MRSIGRFRTLAACIVVQIALATSFAHAQSTGDIAGVVKDVSGSVLPGVTVEASSPALIERTRSATTDGQGQYKITNLRPGAYTVTPIRSLTFRTSEHRTS